MGIESKVLAQTIKAELGRQQRTIVSLAKETGIPNSTLDRKLNHPERYPLTVIDLGSIAEELGLDARDLLDAALAVDKVAA